MRCPICHWGMNRLSRLIRVQDAGLFWPMWTHLFEEKCSVPLPAIESRSPDLYAPYPVSVDGITRKQTYRRVTERVTGSRHMRRIFLYHSLPLKTTRLSIPLGLFLSLVCLWAVIGPFIITVRAQTADEYKTLQNNASVSRYCIVLLCGLVRIGWAGISSSSCNASVGVCCWKLHKLRTKYICICVCVFNDAVCC